MRSTMDVDLVADVKSSHVDFLVSKLSDEFYVSETAIRDAIQRRSSFNLIHLATSFKVDVFVSRARPFDEKAFDRARLSRLGNQATELNVPMASTEDIMLAKLEWFRLGNEVSERQWEDLTRLFKLHRESVDFDYLEKFASELNVLDLLTRLKSENTE